MTSFAEYKSYIETNPLCRTLLRDVPWTLSGAVQANMPATLLNESARLDSLTCDVTFSIITPMYNTPPRLLEELLVSCKLQTWRRWELILIDDCSPNSSHMETALGAAKADPRIKVIRSDVNLGIGGGRNLGMKHATGDWTGFLDHDDLLHPQALGLFARHIPDSKKLGQGFNFISSNECKITEDSKKVSDFFLKPDLCKSTLLRSNYLAHLTFVERAFMAQNVLPDGRFFRKEFDGVEDHDFFLRLAHSPDIRSKHIPEFCYYWRKILNSTADSLAAKPYVTERGQALIRENLGGLGYVVDDLAPHLARNSGQNRFFRASFSSPNNLDHKVLTIVPFRDKTAMTISCLESIEAQDVKVTVVLVDNASAPESISELKRWLGQPRKSRYILETIPGPFNYAKLNNEAITRHANGFEYVHFLNNDVTLSGPRVIRQMVSALLYDPGIAFCGIKLWYPDLTSVQHGGIKIGLEMIGSGYFRPAHMTTMVDFVHDDHAVTAVTFACAISRMQTYQDLGGLDEDWLPNGLGDVDLCLRAITRGFRNFYLGSAEGTHHESITRKSCDESLELSELYIRHGACIDTQMRRQLGYDTFSVINSDAGWLDKPLRYRVADRVNGFLKNSLKPFHRLIKKLVGR